ncbi:MAG: hypothetical protein AABZ47_09540, partial [Planctomycetota bacterium]
CVGGTCQIANNTNPCDDGNLCTVSDICTLGVCVGTPVDCSGLDNDCNVGICNAATGLCEAIDANEGGPCNDGQLCTPSDICVTGVCIGTPVDCSGLDNACNVGVCNTANGLCEAIPINEGGPCDDGLICTGFETCVSGVCVSSGDPCVPLVCDEVNDVCIPPAKVASLELYYSGHFGDQADPSRQFLGVGSTANGNNITNYSNGITGLRVRFDRIVTFATIPRAAFSFHWTTGTGTTFTPVDESVFTISVNAVVDSGVTLVTITLADDHVRNRWLRVTIDSLQVTYLGMTLDGESGGNPVALPMGNGLPGGNAVFVIGSKSGDVDGDRRVTLSDVGLIRPQVNPFLNVPISSLFDVDKSGRVLLSDVGEARVDVNPFVTLPLITP